MVSNFTSCLKFNVLLKDLLKDLIIWFPGETQFVQALSKLELAMTYKIRQPMLEFVNAVCPYTKQIMDQDLQFFTKTAQESNSDALKVFNLPKKVETLSPQQIEGLWQQLKQLMQIVEEGACPIQLEYIRNQS